MLSFVRRFATLNAVFQCLVGAIAIASPAYAAVLFKLDAGYRASPEAAMAISALVRMFGGLLLGSGLLSATIAYDPDKNPWLLQLASVACVVNLVADVLVCSAGDMKFSQLAVGMVLQVLLAMVLTGYALRPRPRGRAQDRPS